ncbi:MAG: septum formation initiator family protein [Clostridia bacterium]|nr:septum formation initiator family protein [Clostridia bacterium]
MSKKFKKMVKLITVCATCLLVVMIAVVFAQQIKIKNLARQEAKLNSELTQLQNKRTSLESGIENRTSDEYIEKQAREQLGLIGDNEIIYIYE